MTDLRSYELILKAVERDVTQVLANREQQRPQRKQFRDAFTKYVRPQGLILESNLGGAIPKVGFEYDVVSDILISNTKVVAKDNSAITSSIKRIISKQYPNSSCHVFGSRASGLALQESDCDIFLQLSGNYYDKVLKYSDQQSLVKEIAHLFYVDNEFRNVIPIFKARVPIIKMYHTNTGIDIDLSFHSGLAVESTKLLKYYVDIDEDIGWLMTAIKLWADEKEIKDPAFLTSNSINWLVLFYLMRRNLIPNVKELQSGCEKNYVGNWNVSFHPKFYRWTRAMTRTSHFKDFFKFITESNIVDNVMCTHTGEFIPKRYFKDFNWLRQYSDGIFSKYVDRMRMPKTRDMQENPEDYSDYDMIELEPLCLQAPIDFSKNCFRLDSKKFEKFRNLCFLEFRNQ